MLEERRYLLFLLAALCFFVASSKIHDRVEDKAREALLHSRDFSQDQSVDDKLATSLLGGARGLISTGLWTKADSLKMEGKYYELVDTYNLIAKLQPSYAGAWAFQAWDLAYNVSVEAGDSPKDRVYWVFMSIDRLRKSAIPRNPKSPELYQYLAWIFMHKVGSEADDAHRYYKQHLAKTVSESLTGLSVKDWAFFKQIADLRKAYPSRELFRKETPVFNVEAQFKAIDPSFDLFASAPRLMRQPRPAEAKLMADPEKRQVVSNIALWLLGEQIEQNLALDPQRMFEMSKKYGPIDWRLPEAHALYWGLLGREARTERKPYDPVMRYEFLIHQCLIKMAFSNDALVAADGQIFCVPDYKFLGPVITELDANLLRLEQINGKRKELGLGRLHLKGLRDGYVNFLINMTLNAYLDKQTRVAGNLLAKLKEVSELPQLFDLPLEQFFAREFARRLQTLSSKELISLVVRFQGRAYRHLVHGDKRGYERRKRWVRILHSMVRQRANEKASNESEDGKEDASFKMAREFLAKNHQDAFGAREVPSMIQLKFQTLSLIQQSRLPGFEDSRVAGRLFQMLQSYDPKLLKAYQKSLRKPAKQPGSN